MRLLAAAILFFSINAFYGCGGPADDDNKGAQSSQDNASNRDNEIPPAMSAQENQDADTVLSGSKPDGTPPNEAPNTGESNPHQSISGQTGNDQTGQGRADSAR